MRREPSKKLDALTMLALAGARKRRRRSPLVTFLFTAVFVFLVWMLVLWIWPGSGPSALSLAAFDQVGRRGDPVIRRAQIEPADDESAADLSGFDLYFQGPAPGMEAKLATARNGMAADEQVWDGVADAPVEFVVRYPGDNRRQPAQDAGRIFLWPADTSVCLIDADHVFTADGPLDLIGEPNAKPIEGAAAALRSIGANHSIVYLSARADSPGHFLRMRAWLKQNDVLPGERLPDGPLLGLGSQPGATNAEVFHRVAVQTLRERFSGTLIAVAGRPDEARIYHAAGARTFLLGEAQEPLEGVTLVDSWADLAAKWKK